MSSRRGGGGTGRGRSVYGEFGGGREGGRGPIYRENEPPFRRKRLASTMIGRTPRGHASARDS